MPLKLLCVVAHPDDECFAFGGALALYSARGVETTVLCLTDGQAATHRGNSASAQDLGLIRRQEFADSCRVLGVTHHQLLDYQDAQLEFADFSHAAGRLVTLIRQFQPQVVLTFGPDGALNTHPDHTMVSMLATAAFHWAASPRRFPDAGAVHTAQRLFHLSTSFFMEGRPAPLPSPWTVRLDIASVLETKREAFRQHHSQAPLEQSTRSLFEKYGRYEHYTLAAAPAPQPATPSADLFDGVTFAPTPLDAELFVPVLTPSR